MQPKSVTTLPTGKDWSYEVKWDGFRAVAIKQGRSVVLLSRSQTDLTKRFPTIASDLANLPIDQCVLDGELVALDADGRPSFSMLGDWYRGIPTKCALAYYGFDVLELNNQPQQDQPLSLRRRMLAKLIRSPSSVLRSQPLPGSVAQIESSIKLFGLEGIVAKKNASRYRAGPTQDWQKIRFSPRQEFVIGGYRLRSERLDCLLVGYYRDGLFCCAGHIREGFTTRNRATLLGLLRGKTASVACPFVDLPHHHPGRGQPHPWDDRLFDLTPYRWCPPTVVVECSYLGWSRHELLRQGRYLGLRIDKAAHAVMRE